MSFPKKPPITYWGGKQQLAAKLLPLFPSHKLYCEPFAGGAALFWLKEPSKIEVLNDINGEVANFYRQLRDNFDALQHRVQSTILSRETYFDAYHIYQRPSMFTGSERAWAFWVLTNQGWCGKIGTWAYGVGDNKREFAQLRKRQGFTDALEHRLKTVQLECNDALKVIQSRDRVDSFFYVDPPYYNSHMGHYGGYTEEDYTQLLDLLSRINGKFILSSYPSVVLKDFTTRFEWYQKFFEMPLSSGEAGSRKVEVVTANFELL